MSRDLFAVSDMHGHLNRVLTAFQAAGLINVWRDWIRPNTTLVCVGDFIDRGPQSKQLIDQLIKWQRQALVLGSNLEFLMGNHEAMMLMAPKHPAVAVKWLEFHVGGVDTLESYGIEAEYRMGGGIYRKGMVEKILAVHKDFYFGLKSFHLQDDTLFVHGGVPIDSAIHLLDKSQSHLWLYPEHFVHLDPHHLRLQYRVGRVVFGHTVFPDGPCTFQDGVYLGIDTGAGRNVGHLTVVRLTPGAFEVAGTSL